MNDLQPPVLPTPPCPRCGRSDQVRRLSEWPTEDLPDRLSPPTEPDLPEQPLGLNEGLGCVGALFFAAAFVLAITSGSLTAGVIFGVFVMFFAAAFSLHLRRGLRERRAYQQRLAEWQQELAAWEQRCYCARDELLFNIEGEIQA